MDPAFIDGQTQEYTAASGAIIIVAVRAGRGLFLDSIVTTDETWVHYFTPESKRSSMQWCHPESPKTKKAKTFSAGKVMATIFWDSKGVLYVDFLTQRCTINVEYYSALLEGPLKAAIRNKRKRAQTCLFSRITPVHTWLLASWTLSRN